MLLPSALPCDRAAHGMVSPPASPPKLSTSATFRIASSSLNLQSLMANTTTTQHTTQHHHHHSHAQPQYHQSYFGGALLPLPTPPMAHAPSPMKKLRLRTRTNDELPPARGIVKRTTNTPSRQHKRTISSDSSSGSSDAGPEPPTTPKRSRIAPECMPLGLARADFHSLEVAAPPPDNSSCSSDWTAEDDGMLVELVLEKLKLSKEDWQDCARALGRDHRALSRRWKSLVLNEHVGLKRRKLASTWR
ncbi:hypothetical protein A9K55_007937 [Cordyceps militaris]|uniref:Myb-like domain-containing protein n=1 Tax=Cordyceps militaris TaxID=73501 RepID=A0A2H4SF74_CORMI|nr:hypothetical protein A9K55_007937 [Cordyceps militaris]